MNAKLDDEFVIYDRRKHDRPFGGGVHIIYLNPQMKRFFKMKLKEFKATHPNEELKFAANLLKIKLLEGLLRYDEVVPREVMQALDMDPNTLSQKAWDLCREDYEVFDGAIREIAHYAEGNVTV